VDLFVNPSRWVLVVVVGVCAVPIGILVAYALARRRMRHGMAPREAWWRSATEVGMVAGTVPWLFGILTPMPGDGLVHLIPFEDLADQFTHPPMWIVYQIGGNLMVFAAYGFLAPVRWPIGPLWVMATAAVASATVEFLQWALHLGRVASVDDVLVNAAGAGLAALCSRRWWRRTAPVTVTPQGV
jgi:glycopeptide antibiotics resistance protein